VLLLNSSLAVTFAQIILSGSEVGYCLNCTSISLDCTFLF
jgi:hypothetical protein